MRNCSLRAISPFPTMFSKDLYCRHVETWERVKDMINNLKKIPFSTVNFLIVSKYKLPKRYHKFVHVMSFKN